jgi:hypothetical protein
MMSDMISSAQQIFSGDQIKENDHGRARETGGGGGGGKFKRVFGGKTGGKEMGVPKKKRGEKIRK